MPGGRPSISELGISSHQQRSSPLPGETERTLGIDEWFFVSPLHSIPIPHELCWRFAGVVSLFTARFFASLEVLFAFFIAGRVKYVTRYPFAEGK